MSSTSWQSTTAVAAIKITAGVSPTPPFKARATKAYPLKAKATTVVAAPIAVALLFRLIAPPHAAQI